MLITNDYHSCYDELLSMLFNLTSSSDKVSNNDTDSINKARVNLINDNLTAHEIIIYSLLLHKCIENQTEEQVITYSELQKLRGKRCGNKVVLDKATAKAYNRAFKGLAQKRVSYDLGNTRNRFKITDTKYEHPLLLIKNTKKQPNGDMKITYSLGPFGRTLIESKRYSNLVPSKYFMINFNEINSYQVALYICRIIYIERRKKKQQLTIKLNSIMKNVNKFQTSREKGLVKSEVGLYYDGPNCKRFWSSIINKATEILSTLKSNYTIADYKVVYNTLDKSVHSANDEYRNLKWILYLNK